MTDDVLDNINKCNASANQMHSPEWYAYERCTYCSSTEDDLPILVWLDENKEFRAVRTSQLEGLSQYDSSFGNLDD